MPAFGVLEPILETGDAARRDTIDVDLTGTADALRAFAPAIVAHGGGRIVARLPRLGGRPHDRRRELRRQGGVSADLLS